MVYGGCCVHEHGGIDNTLLVQWPCRQTNQIMHNCISLKKEKKKEELETKDRYLYLEELT